MSALSDTTYYIGQGQCFWAPRQSNGPIIGGYNYFGDTQSLQVNSKQKTVEVEENTTGFGGTALYAPVAIPIAIKLQLTQWEMANLALATYGANSGAGVGGSVTAETSTAYNGQTTYLANIGISALTLTTAGTTPTALVEGTGAYSRLKYESGVHRVQRVPATEASGRIHTSAATVAVLPEAEEVEVQVDAKDLRIDTFCSSGAGGQSVNTTYSAIRITHLPSNIVVQCQDERSQQQNRLKAMRILKARLYEAAQQEQQDQVAAERRSMVGSGDRSEKIRTYNFPQSRVTDHRIGFTTHRLAEILDGNLDLLLDPLIAQLQAERLERELASTG
ncbi:MAG: hypothetical protein B7Z61_01390 [Acidobacteria bacterium 37-71-11]|nr:MAG: hypothetical protein B7Z61_01390 [Acidobacteria bacterium 37-71-11]